MLGNLSQTSLNRTTHKQNFFGTKFFNDNQLLSESSLSIPVKCLSEKSICLIVNTLIEDLESAKSRIVELEQKNQNGFIEVCQGKMVDNRCASCQSMEDTSQRTLLEHKTVAPKTTSISTSNNNSRKAPEKSSTDELLCRFCSSRHQRGKANCPAQNNVCERCSLPNHFAFCCRTDLKKRLERSNDEEFEDHKVRKTQSCSDSTKLHSPAQADREKWTTVENRKSRRRLGSGSKSRHDQINHENKSVDSQEKVAKEGSGIAETETTLNWINDHLKTNYTSASQIQDKEFRSLMHSIIGWEYGFPQCPNEWLEVIWMMENEKHDLSLNLLWKRDLEEIEKLLIWLKKKEMEKSNKDVPVSKTYVNRFSLSRKEYNARFRHLIPMDCDIHLTPQQKKEKEEKHKARDPGTFWITH